MLVPGTQMHWSTLGITCAEILILFYLLIYRVARPDDRSAYLNIILLVLLLIYNVTGGLLPDPNLPGSFFVQECIAYATGFITPCFFPYYVYTGFRLKAMWFHAFRGIYFFLVSPYILFVCVFAVSGSLDYAKTILVVPVLYALWVLISLMQAIRLKYANDFSTPAAKVEIIVLFLSLSPWVGLPVIAYFDYDQTFEVITTNTGFLLMMALHLYRSVHRLKNEYQRLVYSEQQLSDYMKGTVRTIGNEKEIPNEDIFQKNCAYYQLTKREVEIARLVCAGQTRKNIGQTLFIAERTVAKHVQNIFEKVSVSNRMELFNKLGAYSFVQSG